MDSMYVFSISVNPVASNDRAEWRLMPTVVFQEFSSRRSMQSGQVSLKEAGTKLKSGLEDLR